MRGRVVAWRYRCDCRSRAVMLVLVMMLMILAVGVDSTRVRVMVAEIETSPSVAVPVVVKHEFLGSVNPELNGDAPGTTTSTSRRASSSFNRAEHMHHVWDVETESPPAQRQRDRSLWGMSKRLVPTGPNPLHN